jgi:hypothetical protein
MTVWTGRTLATRVGAAPEFVLALVAVGLVVAALVIRRRVVPDKKDISVPTS